MIISIDSEVFDKIQNPFMTKKSLRKIWIERNIFKLIKHMYKNPTITLYLTVEARPLPRKTENSTRPSLSFNQVRKSGKSAAKKDQKGK